MRKVISRLVIPILLLISIVFYTCDEEEGCKCIYTIYKYDSLGRQSIESKTEIDCPPDMRPGETRFTYFSSGKVKTTLFNPCE